MFDNEEKGISESQFNLVQKELERKIRKTLGEEREKPMRLYFEFDNLEVRNAAMDLIKYAMRKYTTKHLDILKVADQIPKERRA